MLTQWSQIEHYDGIFDKISCTELYHFAYSCFE